MAAVVDLGQAAATGVDVHQQSEQDDGGEVLI
jgi:hypothetical protein